MLFSRCRKYYDEKIDGESRKLTSLNTSLTKLSAEDIGFDTIAPLQEMVTDIQRNISNTKSVRNKLKELQDELFAEIKLVGLEFKFGSCDSGLDNGDWRLLFSIP